jgi:hypothetical protein
MMDTPKHKYIARGRSTTTTSTTNYHHLHTNVKGHKLIADGSMERLQQPLNLWIIDSKFE